MRTKNLNSIEQRIALTVKTRRINQGYTSTDFAKRLGIELYAFSEIEHFKRRISISMLYKIAKIFKCDVMELLPTNETKRC